MECDILIIGGGPGGYVAAIRAAQLGASVALIEKEELGGTCLNKGCIPTKTLLHSSNLAFNMRNAEKYGITDVQFKINYKAMQQRKKDVVSLLRAGVVNLLVKNGVKIVKGEACFNSANDIVVKSGSDEEHVHAQNTIIATGALPAALSVPGDTNLLSNSDEALAWDIIPKELIIVGGGYIGVEFATLFSNLGSKVTLVEMMPSLLPQIDREISSLLIRVLKKKGIDVLTDTKIISVKQKDSKNSVLIEREGRTQELNTDQVIQAVGRTPNVLNLGLKNVGINFDKKGIKVDENYMTNIKGIYAIGDVIGRIQLAHLASAQGINTVEYIMGVQARHNLSLVPSCLFTEPEIASAGITEEQAQDNDIDYAVGRFSLNFSGRAMAAGCTEGLVKIIYGKKDGEVLGVHIVGSRATDLIAEACLAIRLEATVEELATTIHAHPTFSESIMEAANVAFGTPVHYTAMR